MERITVVELELMEIRLEQCKEDFGYLTGDQVVMVKAVEEIKKLREVLEKIAFGYVEGDYADVRQYAREAL